MKSKYLSCLSVFIFLALTFLPLNASSELTAKKSSFDFGTIREGINVPVSFKITNTGKDKAKIQEIRTFAACVQSRPLTQRVLAPGESVELEYVFESFGYGGVSIDKSIEIYYNSRKLSPLRLQVKGQVLALEPYQAPLGELTYNFFVLVDVRSPEYFTEEHILGAINVPLKKIQEWATQVAKSASEDIVIYLYSEDGKESDRAAKLLRQRGFSHYISIVGGLREWKHQHGEKLLVSGKS